MVKIKWQRYLIKCKEQEIGSHDNINIWQEEIQFQGMKHVKERHYAIVKSLINGKGIIVINFHKSQSHKTKFLEHKEITHIHKNMLYTHTHMNMYISMCIQIYVQTYMHIFQNMIHQLHKIGKYREYLNNTTHKLGTITSCNL